MLPVTFRTYKLVGGRSTQLMHLNDQHNIGNLPCKKAKTQLKLFKYKLDILVHMTENSGRKIFWFFVVIQNFASVLSSLPSFVFEFLFTLAPLIVANLGR